MENPLKNAINWKEPASASPLFIIGCQRSGTTFLRTILHAHPDISVGYECAFYKLLADKYYRKQNRPMKNLDEFVEDLYRVRRFNLWNIDKDYLRQALSALPIDTTFPQVVLFIGEIYRQQNKPSASLIGYKNPNGILHVPLIFELYPNARVIHILRDVRGVYASEKKKRNKDGTYNAAYYLWKVSQRYKRAVKTFDTFSDDSRVYNLLYSDLVQDLEETSAQLLHWLNLPWNSQVLSYEQENKLNQLTPKEELWQHGKTLEAPDPSRIAAFSKELNDTELKAIELLCRREITRFSEDFNPGLSRLKGLPLILQAFKEKVQHTWLSST